MSRYAEALLNPSAFAITWELVPGRGAIEKAQEAVLITAEQAARTGKVHALTITDNPGGTPALSAAMLASDVAKLGVEPLIHVTCKDKNRNELESLLYGLERASVRNLLVMTGDYPKDGLLGAPKPVFDLDPVTLLWLIGRLNEGAEIPTLKGSTKLTPTSFFAGVAASPFKVREAEQMGQYYKLAKKVRAGAKFIVSQIGFDARKFHELLLVTKKLGSGQVPVVGNIYMLPLGAARLMNRNGLPGCIVSNKLLAEIEQEATGPDKGKQKRIERAAKMFAVLKGMGYDGAHISGFAMTCDDLEQIIGRGEELAGNWQDLVREFEYPSEDGWYYFEKDHTTGLNSDLPAQRGPRKKVTVGYRAFRALHELMFEKSGPLFGPMQRLSQAVDGSRLEGAFTTFEQVIKGFANECLHCGDCAMLDTGYLCPQSQCPKNQRNGPCGGSFNGYCEKFPGERECVWIRTYERLKSESKEDLIGDFQVPPINYELANKSSWINFYLGRDHSAERIGIAKVPPKKKSGPA
ncbi:MAG TPA: methylenetetrahydrofolate reductase C-terminal domain-containing protein [Terriglobales bacterium]|nr:methylenetetrahydrofolate reductase C-terminal domain-containing protein [Terriglobales bacterium]